MDRGKNKRKMKGADQEENEDEKMEPFFPVIKRIIEVGERWVGAPENKEKAAGSKYSSPSASVDCTLSLGTPSTRLTCNENINHHQDKIKRSFCMSIGSPPEHTYPTSGGNPLLARRCANCDTTSTPLWRNGPTGPKSLCNACGISWKKEEIRSTAVAATSNGGGGVDTQLMMNNSWVQPDKLRRSARVLKGNPKYLE